MSNSYTIDGREYPRPWEDNDDFAVMVNDMVVLARLSWENFNADDETIMSNVREIGHLIDSLAKMGLNEHELDALQGIVREPKV